MKAAVFNNPSRVSFTMDRYNLLRLSINALLAAICGKKFIAIAVDNLEMLTAPAENKEENASRI